MRIQTITAAELLEVLQDVIDEHGGEMPILFTADYGDTGNTPQALPITGDADIVTIEQSSYSHSGFAIVEPEGDEADDDEAEMLPSYVVIR